MRFFSRHLVSYVLMAALRDKLLLSMLAVLAVGVSLSLFLGSSAVVEQDVFALVFAAGGLRFAGVLALVLFAVFHIRRSFESKDVEYLLSRPIGRVAFLVSHFFAFIILAVLFALGVSVTLFAMTPHAFSGESLLWIVSLAVEFAIMINTAMFFAMVLPGAAAAALASLGFYVLARLTGQILGIVDSHVVSEGFAWIGYPAELITMVIPRLDLMAQSTWLVYGVSSDVGMGFVLLHGLVFCTFILLASIVDLVRRQF